MHIYYAHLLCTTPKPDLQKTSQKSFLGKRTSGIVLDQLPSVNYLRHQSFLLIKEGMLKYVENWLTLWAGGGGELAHQIAE